MAVTESDVREAAGAVEDPRLRLTLAELGMVGALGLGGGAARVELALPVPDHPGLDELSGLVRRAVAALDGVTSVEVRSAPMDDDGRRRLRDVLRSAMGTGAGGGGDGADGGRAGRPLGHEQGRPNPFNLPGSRTRVVGVTSGKGGVGKSSVTVNVAVALTRLGHRVGVLDADVYGFSVPAMLGLEETPVVIEDLIVPPVAHGVACISMGFFVGEDQPVIWRGPMLHKALEQFLVDVYWGTPDYLLIDMPPGTGDVALSMAQYLPRSEVVVVTTPQPAAQRVAQRSAYMAKKVGLPLRGVIENMAWFTGDDGTRYELFGSGGGRQLAGALGVPLLGQVPLVPALREGGDVGVPVTASDPDGEAARAFGQLAERVDELGPTRVFRPELKVR
ncbi:MAG TPA: Mrp/NBP35 family ATP-binding protein [Acidimicrobiales bacterium]|nr:Mrp/NBP35 family ATP-binding protein [Acidimicrobiales bacterium]